MADKTITIDLHGDYTRNIGDRIKAGDKIGTCNGHPNFAPHRHFSIVKVQESLAFLRTVGNSGETYSYIYSRPGQFDTLNPIEATPSWFDASASGFSYLEDVRGWYQENYGFVPSGWYIDRRGDYLHDGTDIGSLQNIYKGSDLVSPFDAVIIDKGITPKGLTFLITAPISTDDKQGDIMTPQTPKKSQTNTSKVIKMDYNKRFYIKANEKIKTYSDSNCENQNTTLFLEKDTKVYATKDSNSGNYVLELPNFFIVFIKSEAVDKYTSYA